MSERYGLSYAGRPAARRHAELSRPGSVEADRARSLRFSEARDVLVEGDNLAVMQCLVAAYAGRVDAAYLDPPYNTGHDFIYRDKFAETKTGYLARTGGADSDGALHPNPETAGRFHSNWLAMMEPRLRLVHRLLAEHGVVFVSIDDHEVAQLRLLLDEIFGAESFIAQIVVVANRGGRDYLRIATGHEYILVYGKRPDAQIRPLPRATKGRRLEDARGSYELRELRNRNPRFDAGNRPNLHYPIWADMEAVDADGLAPVSLAAGPGRTRVVPLNSRGEASVWRWGQPKLAAALADGPAGACDVVARARRDGGINVFEKYRKTTAKPRALWDEPDMRTEQGTRRVRELLGVSAFDHPKPVELVARCLQIGMGKDGLVLDPFAGSGTTADAVAQLNAADGGTRRSLCIQMPESLPADAPARGLGCETIGDVAVARIRAVLAEAPGGLRVFVHHEAAEGTAWREGVADGPEYISRLAAQEARRADRKVGPWTLALAAGVALHADVRAAGPGAWWMEGPVGDVLVVTAPQVRTPLLQRLDPPAGSHVALASSAFDDDAAAWMMARQLQVHLGDPTW
jgi:adenine-specific DNA-methyltransferase